MHRGMRYLTVSDVCEIHHAEAGESFFDFGLLESAVLRPQQTVAGQDVYPDLHTKAAALFHSLVRNHAFLDGNKRTAVLAVIVFYNLNGWTVHADSGEIVALAVDTAEDLRDVDAIAKSLGGWARPIALLDSEDESAE
ncbi:hypothetical protein BH20ACT24_BH20ACT24_20920 [soil metagenome]